MIGIKDTDLIYFVHPLFEPLFEIDWIVKPILVADAPFGLCGLLLLGSGKPQIPLEDVLKLLQGEAVVHLPLDDDFLWAT